MADIVEHALSLLPPAERAAIQQALDAAAAEPISGFIVKKAGTLLVEMLPPDRAAVALRAVAGAFSLIARASPQVADAMRTVEGRLSIAMAVAMTAITGFSPGLPGTPGAKAYLIPRKNKGTQVVSWQIAVAGLREMASEDGWTLTAIAVHAGDLVMCPSASTGEYAMELVPGGESVPPGARDDKNRPIVEAPWLPVPLDESTPTPPAMRRQQAARTWDTLAGFLVLARSRDTGKLHAWRFVDRSTLIIRRDSSDSYGYAANDVNLPEAFDGRGKDQNAWKRDKAFESPWIKWPLEMAEKAAIGYALRRGMVPLADRLTAVLRAENNAAQTIDTTSEVVQARPRIHVPTQALPAPSLDTTDETAKLDRVPADREPDGQTT